ncbi:hypothetical protein KMZ29_08445 [Bradyrhizobium sediminis]|uniref:Uncharacterized protein n=1 Tax=Bradyrhizobium sediminis TaxID=2840469 RepID=A0A975NGF6_9BRAD|nr:DUF6156 family protein [Bradyrhizobium sediminis]QWG14673.1 hypothetical protein KMZ29_08445 [Bradyrhizobium sediminis]
MDDVNRECRFFVSYSGVKLPFNLVNPIDPEMLSHRNTFIRAYFDQAGKLSGFDKVVYGEVELSHRYEYHANGALKRAEIAMPDEEPAALDFDEAAAPGVRPVRAAGIDEEGP